MKLALKALVILPKSFYEVTYMRRWTWVYVGRPAVILINAE